MSSVSEVIDVIRTFQEARRQERVARECVADRLCTLLRTVASCQLGPTQRGLYDSGDFGQTIMRRLAEDDFRQIADLNVENEQAVAAYFRTLVRHKLIDVATPTGNGIRGEGGDESSEFEDTLADDPADLILREEELVRWEHLKSALKPADRHLIGLAEEYWKEGKQPDWTRIAGQLSEVTPDAYRVRCYAIRMRFRRELGAGYEGSSGESAV